MKDKFDLGLYRPIEEEMEHAIKFLNKKSEKHKELLVRLIECAYDIQNNKVLNREHLELFLEGMKQNFELVFCDYSGKFVSFLSYNFIVAEELLKSLANDKSSKIRYNSLTILLFKPKGSVIEHVIKKCISDKSSKVRIKVADVCQRLDLIEMVPILESQWLIEEEATVKSKLKFSISLIRDGFIVEEDNSNKINILLKLEDNCLKGITVDKDYLILYSLKEIIKSEKEKGKLPWG